MTTRQALINQLNGTPRQARRQRRQIPDVESQGNTSRISEIFADMSLCCLYKEFTRSRISFASKFFLSFASVLTRSFSRLVIFLLMPMEPPSVFSCATE